MESSSNIVYGRNPVIEAIKSGREIEKLYVSKTAGGSVSKIIKLARENNIIVSTADNLTLDKLSGNKNHQGVLAACSVYKYYEVDDIINYAESKKEKPFILILDGVTDTHNFGAIIRSAEVFGVHGIIIPKRRSATVNSTVVKTSAGAIEYMRIAKVSNINNTISKLKDKGIWIVGTDLKAKEDFSKVDLDIPVAVVIGSENTGVSKLVLENCDFTVKIPQKGNINSLNVSVAASLIMYQIMAKRENKA
ncbi:MAG: 23S rRNA (guanosine(2251)-2'-O)-methyltransferase RlmB [Thermoanaerobacteraceae bacterium]